MATNEPLPVEFDELLAAEFDYIAQTAIQANEDRARVSSFYLIAVGSLVAALFGTQFFDPNFFAEVRPIELPEGIAPPDNAADRWDRTSVHAFRGTYGDYLLNKVGKVFPGLRQEVM